MFKLFQLPVLKLWKCNLKNYTNDTLICVCAPTVYSGITNDITTYKNKYIIYMLCGYSQMEAQLNCPPFNALSLLGRQINVNVVYDLPGQVEPEM